MKTEKALAVLEPFLHLEEEAGIAIIRLTDDILSVGEELKGIEAFQCLLDDLQGSSARAVLCITTTRCFSPERCNRLWQRVGSLNGQRLKSNWFPDPMTKVALDREESVFGKLIGWLRRMPKPVIMTFRGQVVFPFLGVGLACEYRLASGDTVFYNRCHELGVPPGAGLLYMLPAYVGFGGAASLVMRVREIAAEEALELGLVDRLTPDEELDLAAEMMAAEAAKCCPGTVGAIKRLLNHHLPPLDAYFADEMREIERALDGRPWEKVSGGASDEATEV